METLFYGICDRGSSHEYFETFPSLLHAKLIEIQVADTHVISTSNTCIAVCTGPKGLILGYVVAYMLNYSTFLPLISRMYAFRNIR